MGRLRALKSLVLQDNRFTGTYPAVEISELAGLEMLALGFNEFASAPVPRVFANLAELRILDMSSNTLTGSIPAWLLQQRASMLARHLMLYDVNPI